MSEKQKTSREESAANYAWTHGDSQTRTDYLAGWDAAIKAGEVGGDNTEYGIRPNFEGGEVMNWGTAQLERDPANFPGYTLMSRKVGDWQPLTPKGGS